MISSYIMFLNDGFFQTMCTNAAEQNQVWMKPAFVHYLCQTEYIWQWKPIGYYFLTQWFQSSTIFRRSSTISQCNLNGNIKLFLDKRLFLNCWGDSLTLCKSRYRAPFVYFRYNQNNEILSTILFLYSFRNAKPWLICFLSDDPVHFKM